MSTPNKTGDEKDGEAAVDEVAMASRTRSLPLPQAVVDETTTTTVKKQKMEERHFVVVSIPIGEGTVGERKLTTVDVSDGDDIDDIKTKLKEKCSNVFAATDTVQLKLFTSKDQKKLLGFKDKWKPNVTWGTKEQPLFVVAPETTSSHSGKCD